MSMKTDELLEEVSGYLHGYLKSGTLRIDPFLSKMNLNIKNLSDLLTVRFLLKKETTDFVRSLPILLEQFKTTTTLKNEVNRGEIRGEIDWSETIKERLSKNYRDKTLYSTRESVRSYNIPENLVLKELLSLLNFLLYENNYIEGFEDADWFKEWQGIKGNVSHAFKKNIYLQRVDQVKVPNRLIQKTLSHRNKLYRDAARLLLEYRKLMNGRYSEDDIKLLLQETFIAPGDINTLFELYWIIQLIKQNSSETQLYLLDGRSSAHNIIASWEDNEQLYYLYHDSSGSKSIDFRVPLKEIEDSVQPIIQQKYRSFNHSNQLASEVFNKSLSSYIWNGRPDFLVEIYDKNNDELKKLVIGEVKNTKDISYASKGLGELLDYIYFVKSRKASYLLDSDVTVQGILCLGKMKVNKPVEEELIKVVTLENMEKVELTLK